MATEQVNDEQHLNRCNRILAAFESGLGDDDISFLPIKLIVLLESFCNFKGLPEVSILLPLIKLPNGVEYSQ